MPFLVPSSTLPTLPSTLLLRHPPGVAAPGRVSATSPLVLPFVCPAPCRPLPTWPASPRWLLRRAPRTPACARHPPFSSPQADLVVRPRLLRLCLSPRPAPLAAPPSRLQVSSRGLQRGCQTAVPAAGPSPATSSRLRFVAQTSSEASWPPTPWSAFPRRARHSPARCARTPSVWITCWPHPALPSPPPATSPALAARFAPSSSATRPRLQSPEPPPSATPPWPELAKSAKTSPLRLATSRTRRQA
mmetsp:Transcript_128970/g.413069  ORF Transcript_128970/g.413069 Transcript_128970/m.413069 type:complete len:246 (-) Transcript_128970:3861-4598(-)